MITLIGEKQGKRTEYFLQAAKRQGAEIRLLAWDELPDMDATRVMQGAVIKIDPPSFRTADFALMEKQLGRYREMLRQLSSCSCHFLNRPEAILAVLDKRQAKQVLQQQGVSVTEMLAEEIHSCEDFFDWMRSNHYGNVFIKPVTFSGAAGVAAFRMQARTGRMKLYTSAHIQDGRLCNTKQLFCLEERRAITEFLERLFQMDVIVERWHPKDTMDGKAYDLRVVYQFGHIAHAVVRRAGFGPITNLHLNNQAEWIENLHLSSRQLAEITELCAEACRLFPGLQSAGVDVMLEKGSRKPRIIEINGQGDLIYQDICHKNKIYGEQVRALCSL